MCIGFIVFYIPNRNGITRKKPQMANKKLLRFSCFRIRKCPHFVSIGCNGKQIGVFGLHCRQDLFAIPGEKIINPTD